MTLMDIISASAGGLAFGWLAIRANMLKPGFDSWCSAPTLVWAALLLLAVTCGVVALSIVRTGVHATPREALLLVVLSVTSLVMLVNLHRQAPKPSVPEEQPGPPPAAD